MVYQVKFTVRGRESFRQIADYLMQRVGGIGNAQAAINFLNDYDETLKKIELGAEAYAFCEDEELRKRGVRKVRFLKHNYKIFYHVIERTAYIEAILHDKQDFENVLK